MAEDAELEAIRARLRREIEARVAIVRPVEIDPAGFDAWLTAHPVAMVDVWAAWCGPCRMMEPVVEELAQEWGGRIAVGKLDADAAPHVVDRFRISGIPQFLFFREGRLAGRLVGARPKRDFLDVAAELVSAKSP